MPDKPNHVDEELKKFSKTKLPHFFKYAKDKEEHQVSSINSSTVNMLEEIIPNKPIRFKHLVGEVNHKHLKKIKSRKVDEELIEAFIEVNRSKHFTINEDGGIEGFIIKLKERMNEFSTDEDYIVDVLVEHFFQTDSKSKATLWDVYGETIYKNLVKSLGNTIQCDNCTTRFKAKKNESLCEVCKKEVKNRQNRGYRKNSEEKLKR